MAATPYKPLSWADNEPIYTDKINGMTNNDQWLFENMPRMYYNAHGIKKTNGVRIMTGFGAINATKSSANSGVFHFGSFFSSGCRPVVVASFCVYPQAYLHLTTRGIGTLFPDHRGFELRAYSNEPNPKNNHIRATIWVPFIAIGW